ncbi:hypothetical protein Tco_1098077 [Tanacetum coccineum]
MSTITISMYDASRRSICPSSIPDQRHRSFGYIGNHDILYNSDIARKSEELSDLKKTLNVEVDQLRSEFQELRTTLQQQQEDVTVSLKNLGLQDVSGDVKDTEGSKVEGETI